MKKLSKIQRERREELAGKLSNAYGHLSQAIEAYNATLAEVKTFCEEVVADIQTYVDDRSEKWQESDASTAYDAWKEPWEQLDLEDFVCPDDPAEAFLALDEEVQL